MSRLWLCLILVLVIGSSLVKCGSEVDAVAVATGAEEDEELSESRVGIKLTGGQEINEEEKKGNEGVHAPPTDGTQPKHTKLKDAPAESKEATTPIPDENIEQPGKDLPSCSQTKVARRNSPKKKKKHRKRKGKSTGQEAQDEEDLVKHQESKIEAASLTRYNCINALSSPALRSMCCHTPGFDEDMTYCLANTDTVHSSTKNENEIDADLMECMYMRKKYFKTGETLDMDRIAADAAKLNNTKRGDFMLDMYIQCEKLARDAVKDFKKKQSEFQTMYSSKHEVFVIVLFNCTEDYLQSTACPYFHWRGKCAEKNVECLRYARHCKTLLGH